MRLLAWTSPLPGPIVTSDKLSKDYDFSTNQTLEVEDGDAEDLLRLCSSSFKDLSEFLAYGSLGSSIPAEVLYFSGVIRDDAVNWSNGATCIAVLEMNVDSSAVTVDTQISGGLYATATGLEFQDGTNTATYDCTWSAGETLSVVLSVTLGGKMKLGLLVEQAIDLLAGRYLNTENYIDVGNYI